MSRRWSAAIASVALATACGGEDTQSSDAAPDVIDEPEIDPAAVMAISAEFAIQKGMTEACSGSQPDLLSPFLEELQDLGASPGLMTNVERVANAMYEMARGEEPEYVCTPEMFEDAAERVAKAQRDWDAIKESAE